MTIKESIERAIKGGYDYNGEIPPFYDMLCQFLLDPKFWQALAKTEGWEGCDECPHSGCCGGRCPGSRVWHDGWDDKMMGMTRALIEGRSIESFLASL